MAVDGVRMQAGRCSCIHVSTSNHENERKINNLGWMLYSVHAVLGVCCTGCKLYSVYAVLVVSCTGCMLYWVYTVLSLCNTWCILYSMYAVLGVNS